MKYMVAIALLITASVLVAQEAAPTYDVSKEIVLKGVVQETREYRCPVTGTVGAHMAVLSDAETLEGRLVEQDQTFRRRIGCRIENLDA